MFNKNDTVCFLGDSITTHGHFIKEIFEFLAKNHKEDRVKMFNCGVPGDAACRTVKRLYEDCLILNPQKVVLMLGANDIERSLYMPGKEIENVEEKRKHFIDLYKTNIREIVENCIAFGAEVILCTPTPTEEEKSPAKGCNVPLELCIDFLKELAKEKNLMLIDYNTTLSKMYDKNVISEDGLHPTETGHHVMAQLFLKALGYIKECDFVTMPEYSQKNIERFNAEQTYRDVRFLEWSSMFDFNMSNPDATTEEKKEVARQKRQDGIDTKADWFVKSADNYIKYIDKVPKLQAEVLKKTIEMYD